MNAKRLCATQEPSVRYFQQGWPALGCFPRFSEWRLRRPFEVVHAVDRTPHYLAEGLSRRNSTHALATEVRPRSFTAVTVPIEPQFSHAQACATCATISQVVCFVAELKDDAVLPINVFGAEHDPTAISHGLAGVKAHALAWIGSKSVFHPDPAWSTGGSKRPARHSSRSVRFSPETWPTSDAGIFASDTRAMGAERSDVHGPHQRLSSQGPWAGVKVVIRIEVEHLPKPSVCTEWTF
jgi:hypothetical protein